MILNASRRLHVITDVRESSLMLNDIISHGRELEVRNRRRVNASMLVSDTFPSHTKAIEASIRGMNADLGIIGDAGARLDPEICYARRTPILKYQWEVTSIRWLVASNSSQWRYHAAGFNCRLNEESITRNLAGTCLADLQVFIEVVASWVDSPHSACTKCRADCRMHTGLEQAEQSPAQYQINLTNFRIIKYYSTYNLRVGQWW